MLAVSMRELWLALLALICGCDRSTQLQTQLYCARMWPGPGEGLNPALAGHYACFETLAACSKTSSSCSPSGPPRWFCTSIHAEASGDPLSGDASCYPTEAMCRASQLRTADERIVVSDCAPVASVYCYATDGLVQCTTDRASCERSRDLGRSVMHVKSTACAPR
jgi:hypothetical protein